MDINTRDGRAWLKGKELAGDEAKKHLEQAYAAWVNDTYWLLMPYKLKDPGVTLDAGRRGDEGRRVLGQAAPHLRQRGADAEGQVLGLRQPQDRPRRSLGLRPQGREQAADVLHVDQLEEVRRVMLADDRSNATDDMRIHFPVLEVPESLPDVLFSAP